MSKDYPIMLGHGLRKGVFIGRSRFHRGFLLAIVWLKRDMPSGERFSLEDIDGVNATLNFCDKESVRITINALQTMLEMWEETEEEQETTEYDYNEYTNPACKSCGFQPFAGYIPTLKWMQQRGYNYCPGCGKKVKWDD